ncbi:MAG: hypothetical protein AAF400_00300, partial [Bacteroidota bacterium]
MEGKRDKSSPLISQERDHNVQITVDPVALNSMQHNLESALAAIQTLQNQVSQLRDENQKLQGKLDSMQLGNSQLQHQIDSLNQDTNQLKRLTGPSVGGILQRLNKTENKPHAHATTTNPWFTESS